MLHDELSFTRTIITIHRVVTIMKYLKYIINKLNLFFLLYIYIYIYIYIYKRDIRSNSTLIKKNSEVIRLFPCEIIPFPISFTSIISYIHQKTLDLVHFTLDRMKERRLILYILLKSSKSPISSCGHQVTKSTHLRLFRIYVDI